MCREESLKSPTPGVSRNREISATTKRKEDASVLSKLLKYLNLLSIDLSSWFLKIKINETFLQEKF